DCAGTSITVVQDLAWLHRSSSSCGGIALATISDINDSLACVYWVVRYRVIIWLIFKVIILIDLQAFISSGMEIFSSCMI
ncbi:MAG: hypothetical protein ACMV1B_12800, partial [Prevotella sp.]